MKKALHIVLFLHLLVFFSCKKDHNVLGVEAQPAADALSATFSDTSKIYVHTIKYDSIVSFDDRYKFLGSNQDPQFGRTDVGLYLNANIPNGNTNVSFGEDPHLVSAEIILTVASLNFLGTYTNAISYSVFPVTTALDKSKLYTNFASNLHNKNSVLGTYNGTFAVIGEKLVLKIPMDFNYANSILTNPVYLENNSKFLETYKGFYISAAGTNLNPIDAQGCITRFDVEDELSGFYLYYQNGEPSATKENKSYRFSFSGNDAVKFNTIKYDLSSIPNNALYDQIVNKDSTRGAQNVFLKGLGGTRIKVYIPGLANYADSSPVSVNRAEIIFYTDQSLTAPGGNYFYPPKFSLLPIDEAGNELFAVDQLNAADLSKYDGMYNSTSNQVSFNIARHVQAIMRGVKKNYGFYLVIADPSPVYTGRRDNYSERVIFGGTSHPSLKPKFNFSYVKLPQDN